MQHLLTRWRVVWLIATATAVLILIAAFYTPPAHEVHTPGGKALQAQGVVSEASEMIIDPRIRPSQSLDTVRCEIWRVHQLPTSTCPNSAALARRYFPRITQSVNKLYLPWRGCPATGRDSEGENVEYLPASRTLAIHCYSAESFISMWRPNLRVAQLPPILLLVPTESLSVGNISIVEEDRVEHLWGDHSYMNPIATATIS